MVYGAWWAFGFLSLSRVNLNLKIILFITFRVSACGSVRARTEKVGSSLSVSNVYTPLVFNVQDKKLQRSISILW